MRVCLDVGRLIRPLVRPSVGNAFFFNFENEESSCERVERTHPSDDLTCCLGIIQLTKFGNCLNQKVELVVRLFWINW